MLKKLKFKPIALITSVFSLFLLCLFFHRFFIVTVLYNTGYGTLIIQHFTFALLLLYVFIVSNYPLVSNLKTW